ncbi:MAG: triosephosphate isomerase [Glaciecola sp.]|jgi:triosephosphate isomerase
MAKKIVAGNWKMNKDLNAAVALVEDLKNKIGEYDTSGVSLIVSPPYLYLSEILKTAQGSGIKVSAQNVHQEASGAYTGEVSVDMLKSIGLDYTIIGHSERRQYFAETSAQISSKVVATINGGLNPIYCCGEVKEEREAGDHFKVVEQQLTDEVFNLSAEDFSKVVIAYEPVWAIGTGLTASPDQAQEIHAFIRGLVAAKYGDAVAADTSILYGGSCKPGNAKEIFGKADVDGGLIGGAALLADDFLQIAAAFN